MAERKRILFIAGAGRSGSTLLSQMLGQMPGVLTVGELSLLWTRGLLEGDPCGCGVPIRACPHWRSSLSRAFDEGLPDPHHVLAIRSRSIGLRAWLTHRSLGDYPPSTRPAVSEYRALMEGLYAAIAAEGALVVVDSSKFVTHVMPLLQSKALDIRVLHLVRDSRAVAFSLQRTRLRADAARPGVLMNTETPSDAARYWMKINLVTQLVGGAHRRYLRVRYEDLVNDPREQLRRCAAFMGVDPGPLSFVSDDGVVVSTQHSVAGNPMRLETGRLALRLDDEWEWAMGRRIQRQVLARTWPLMAAYGYLDRRDRSTRPGGVSTCVSST